MRVLVTGSEGFIGGHLVARFRTCGWDVSTYDTQKYYNPIQHPLEPDPSYDCIVHAGAHADISDNWRGVNRSAVYESNTQGVFDILEACHDTPVIFLSTAAVYGAHQGMATEETIPYATSPYAASKLAGEAMVQAYTHATQHRILRLSAVVGAGYTHGHIADFVEQARTFGVIRGKSDGRPTRSYTHVEDVVSAVEMCAHGAIPQGTYNVSSGSWSCRDTVRVMGVKATWPDNMSAWVGDHPFTVSSQRLRSFGWVSKRSVEQGVREALASLGHAR